MYTISYKGVGIHCTVETSNKETLLKLCKIMTATQLAYVCENLNALKQPGKKLKHWR
jgi:hypothetical protein